MDPISQDTEDLLKKAPFPISVYGDKLGNTVLRVKIPKEKAIPICELLIQRGNLIEEIKQIFLFHNLENPIRIQTDEQSNCYWDILIHTQDHQKVSAILELMANKANLFSLKVPALDQIQPLPVFAPSHPELPPQKTGGRTS